MSMLLPRCLGEGASTKRSVSVKSPQLNTACEALMDSIGCRV